MQCSNVLDCWKKSQKKTLEIFMLSEKQKGKQETGIMKRKEKRICLCLAEPVEQRQKRPYVRVQRKLLTARGDMNNTEFKYVRELG